MKISLATKRFNYWITIFLHFLGSFGAVFAADKPNILVIAEND
jgi:hypothetical protein